MTEVTVGQVLAQVDGLLPNGYTREEKLRWLRQAEGYYHPGGAAAGGAAGTAGARRAGGQHRSGGKAAL